MNRLYANWIAENVRRDLKKDIIRKETLAYAKFIWKTLIRHHEIVVVEEI